MLGYVPGRDDAAEGGPQAQPGERLVVADGEARVERWWRYPRPAADPASALRAEWAEIVLAKLDESVGCG